MEDIAKLALAVPEMNFSAELRKQMFVIAHIHQCMRAQAHRFRSERRAALELAQEQRKRLSPGSQKRIVYFFQLSMHSPILYFLSAVAGDNRGTMTKAQKLAMKYAVRMILLLVRSVQKVEGQLFLDVLNMASSLLQNVPALALANSKSFPPEAAEVSLWTHLASLTLTNPYSVSLLCSSFWMKLCNLTNVATRRNALLSVCCYGSV